MINVITVANWQNTLPLVVTSWLLCIVSRLSVVL
jgi:hypothetical protein